jgi:lysylphosphatidylglycerol synthetase-like protein (DUF2156 family)
VNKVAVVLGDPVCALETGEQVTQSFLDVCARHHWRVAFYQASPAYLATYHALSLTRANQSHSCSVGKHMNDFSFVCNALLIESCYTHEHKVI